MTPCPCCSTPTTQTGNAKCEACGTAFVVLTTSQQAAVGRHLNPTAADRAANLERHAQGMAAWEAQRMGR